MTKKHTIETVIDRLVLKDGIQKRLTDSVETALRLSGLSVKCFESAFSVVAETIHDGHLPTTVYAEAKRSFAVGSPFCHVTPFFHLATRRFAFKA